MFYENLQINLDSDMQNERLIVIIMVQSRNLAKWASGPLILQKGAILDNATPNVQHSNYGPFITSICVLLLLI